MVFEKIFNIFLKQRFAQIFISIFVHSKKRLQGKACCS